MTLTDETGEILIMRCNLLLVGYTHGNSCNHTNTCVSINNTRIGLFKVSDEADNPNLYANMPMKYTAIFHGCKTENFQMKSGDIFSHFCSNIDVGTR